MKFYEVTFITKKGGTKFWALHIGASNAKEAKAKMQEMWKADQRLAGMHTFDISVKKLPDTSPFEFNYFTVTATYA